MKKILILTIAVLMIFSLVACGDGEPADVTTPEETTPQITPNVTTPQSTPPVDTPAAGTTQGTGGDNIATPPPSWDVTTPTQTPEATTPVITTPVVAPAVTTPLVTTPVVTPAVTTPVVTTPVETPAITTPVVTTPVETPVATTPVVTTPVETPVATTPVVTTPVETPAVTTPVVTTPVETPVVTTPVVTTPVETPAVTTPVATTPVETPEITTPVATTPVETPVVTDPVETTPAETTPIDTTPTETPVPVVKAILFNEGENGKLQLEDATATYTIYGAVYTPDTDGKIDISSSWYGLTITIVRKSENAGVPDSSLDYEIPAQPTTQPSVTGGYETIKGIDTTMQYRVFGTDKWLPVTDTEFEPGKYYVRYAATATAFASKQTSYITVLAKVPEATPDENTVKIDYVNGKLEFADASAKYSIFGVTYTPDENGKIDIDSYWYGIDIEIIKEATSEEKANSAAGTITVESRPSKPIGVKGGFEKITGVNDKLEYFADEWIAVEGSEVINLPAGSYQVRVAAVEGESFASLAVTVTVKAKTAEEIPAVAIDYVNRTLEFPTDGSFTVNGESVAPADGILAIKNEWLGTSLSIVRISRDGDEYKDSAAQTLNVPSIPATPNPVGGVEKISNLTTSMVYKSESGGIWMQITSDVVTVAPGTYVVYIPATASSFASETVTVTVTAQETTPADTTAEDTPTGTDPADTEPADTDPVETTPVETDPPATLPSDDGWTKPY